MNPYRAFIAAGGAAASLALATVATALNGPVFVHGLEQQATLARDAAGGQAVTVAFRDRYGWLTRHPILTGGERLDAQTRSRVAEAVAGVPGIGGIRWRREGQNAGPVLHCQDDVERILETRTIRFSEASARIDPASNRLLDEVARALRPCVGSIIAVAGHTDDSGNAEANRALSLGRAEAVRWALVGRGLPADGLRTVGLGSTKPIPGLDVRDPANRRIEFSVIQSAPVKPTPIDTPGAE